LEPKRQPSLILRYVAAVGAVAIALLFHLMLLPGGETPFMFFWPAVFFAAWYGGFGPGLIATVLSALAADFFLMLPLYSLRLFSSAQVTAEAIFLLLGFLISLICERLQRTESAAQEERSRLAAVVEISADAITCKQEADSQLAAIVESSQDAIISKSRDGTILTWNQGAEQMYGYSASEAVGRNISIIVPQDQASELAEMIGRLNEGAEVECCEALRRRKDGKLIDASISINPIKGVHGQTLAYATISRDITEQKKTEHRIRLLAHLQAVVADLGQLALRGKSNIVDEAVFTVARTLGVEYCKVLELLPSGQALLLRSGVGWKEGLVGRATVGSGTDSQAGYTLLSDEPVIVEDLRTETRFSVPPLLHDHGVVSGMSVIISTSQGPYGVLGAHTTSPRIFTKDEVHFLQAVANVLGTAIQRQRAEEQLRRVNRAHRALSSCNQALIRATNESVWVAQVCRIIVEEAGYRQCWVGYAEHDEAKTVRQIANAGLEDGFGALMNATWADTEFGRGPTGTCIRTSATVVLKNIATDSTFQWRDEALKRGYGSAIALPLVADKTLLGALSIYASEPNAFLEEEISLLTELANDLAFGVIVLRTRAERAAAGAALRENEQDVELFRGSTAEPASLPEN
jgi:PAS domain S-box-containing protein